MSDNEVPVSEMADSYAEFLRRTAAVCEEAADAIERGGPDAERKLDAAHRVLHLAVDVICPAREPGDSGLT